MPSPLGVYRLYALLLVAYRRFFIILPFYSCVFLVEMEGDIQFDGWGDWTMYLFLLRFLAIVLAGLRFQKVGFTSSSASEGVFVCDVLKMS